MFASFGVRIGIRVNHPNSTGPLEGVLPPGCIAFRARRADRLFSLVVGASIATASGLNSTFLRWNERLASVRELAPVLKLLEINLRRTVAGMAPRRVFVHAGVVDIAVARS